MLSSGWSPGVFGSFILALTVLLGPNAAHAQDASPAEMRREIERLRGENDRLQSLLREAREQSASLERANRELRSRLDRADVTISQIRSEGTAMSEPAEDPLPVPEDPFASPSGLLNELRVRYDAELASMPLDGKREEQIYREMVRRWCTNTSRDLRGRFTWIARVEDVEDTGRSRYEALVTVLDPTTFKPVDRAIRIPVPRKFVSRLQGSPRFDMWRLTGVLTADPSYAPERVEPGLFDTPAFVGRFAEFGFSAEWLGVEGVTPESLEEERKRDAKREAAPAGDAESEDVDR